jgi:hypothetical protein
MARPAAIYARVSSDRQKENHTICSQLAALEEYAGSHGYLVPPEWRRWDLAGKVCRCCGALGPEASYASWRRRGITEALVHA